MQDKRYSIVLKGRVQDVSFRSRIISTARIYNLRGYPPTNDIDGSVKMICEGPEELIDKFLEDIDIREELPSGIRVEVLEKKEIPLDFPVPLRPALLEGEELSNISRKLDVGNERLKKIEVNTDSVDTRLGSIEGTLGSMDTRLGSIEGTLGSMDTRLGSIEGTLGSMDTRLGSIEGTLTDMNATLPKRIAEALKDVLR